MRWWTKFVAFSSAGLVRGSGLASFIKSPEPKNLSIGSSYHNRRTMSDEDEGLLQILTDSSYETTAFRVTLFGPASDCRRSPRNNDNKQKSLLFSIAPHTDNAQGPDPYCIDAYYQVRNALQMKVSSRILACDPDGKVEFTTHAGHGCKERSRDNGKTFSSLSGGCSGPANHFFAGPFDYRITCFKKRAESKKNTSERSDLVIEFDEKKSEDPKKSSSAKQNFSIVTAIICCSALATIIRAGVAFKDWLKNRKRNKEEVSLKEDTCCVTVVAPGEQSIIIPNKDDTLTSKVLLLNLFSRFKKVFNRRSVINNKSVTRGNISSDSLETSCSVTEQLDCSDFKALSSTTSTRKINTTSATANNFFVSAREEFNGNSARESNVSAGNSGRTHDFNNILVTARDDNDSIPDSGRLEETPQLNESHCNVSPDDVNLDFPL